ncbi:hypothetical protein KHA80_07250 [Anaerobacillus sp. HL2]|nr:hypothetical protein KHA80_07250 [Anaerobacillus sp. HL2]
MFADQKHLLATTYRVCLKYVFWHKKNTPDPSKYGTGAIFPYTSLLSMENKNHTAWFCSSSCCTLKSVLNRRVVRLI